MRYMLPLLLLAGCATTTLDDLYAMRAACNSQKGECDEIHEAIDEKERIHELREYQDIIRCPVGTIEYCDQTMKGCGSRYRRQSDKFLCITPQTLRDAMNRMNF